MNKLTQIFLAAAMLMIFSGQAFGQMGFNKGVKAGLNFATLRPDPSDGFDVSSRTGLAAGVFLELDPLGPLAIQVEALFSQRGAKNTVTFAGNSAETTFKINYIEIPVLVKIGLPLTPLTSYNVYAGPSFGIKAGESTDPEATGEESDVDIWTSSDMGIAFGFSLDISALVSKVIIDVRYTLGIADILDDDSDDTSVKNGAATVTVGLGF